MSGNLGNVGNLKKVGQAAMSGNLGNLGNLKKGCQAAMLGNLGNLGNLKKVCQAAMSGNEIGVSSGNVDRAMSGVKLNREMLC